MLITEFFDEGRVLLGKIISCCENKTYSVNFTADALCWSLEDVSGLVINKQG